MLSFRTRILGLLLALVVTIQIATMIALVVKTQGEAQSRSRTELEAGGRVLSSLMHSRAEQLRNAVQVLVADFGFKEAVASGDRSTVLSALENSAGRIDADLAAYFDTEGRVLATTLAEIADSAGIEWPARSAAVADSGIVYRTFSGRPYLLVIAPVRAPVPIGRVAIGFRIDAALASEMRSLLGVDVTFYDGATAAAAGVVSTLSGDLRAALLEQLPQLITTTGDAQRVALGDNQHMLLIEPVEGASGRLYVILQTSLADILRPMDDLRTAILVITVLALVLAVPLALMLARSASRPLDQLVEAAQRIEGGNYSTPVELNSTAEFTSLAATLNSMQARVSEREQQIRHRALHDAVTGLPNLLLFREQLESGLEAARRLSVPMALLLVELRDFNQIQASFGHAFGDEVLREMARRLTNRVSAEEHVAHSTESQFVLLLPGGDETRARVLAGQIIESVGAGLIRDDVPVSLNAHVAICTFPAHAEDAETLLRRLNIALCDARQSGAPIEIYEPGREEGHRRQLAILGELRRGIDNGELELHYQPKVHILTQRVQSLEALVRWNHPRHGRIPPGEFVPLAERAGSIILLTSWVLKTAYEQMKAWANQGFILDVSVNLSAGDLSDPELPELVRGRLRDAGALANRLVLEITESAVMHETARVVRVMEELRHDGVRFSIDDFGTGYSSLAQLKRLPVDEIKIDKSFVLDLERQNDDALIVRSTIELGHSLGVKVVAEGVETAGAWNMLQQMGCDMAQGFFISAPLPGREVVNWVRALNSKLESAETPTQQVRVLKEHRRANS
jgi:diguanylate cyclase (GGDEF)-like protein